VNGLWFEERWCSAGTFKYISTRLYTAVHHHWCTLICFVVSATGVAVAWLWQCLCAGNLQWQTWQLDVVLPQPCWYCLLYWGSISLIRIFHWEISILKLVFWPHQSTLGWHKMHVTTSPLPKCPSPLLVFFLPAVKPYHSLSYLCSRN